MVEALTLEVRSDVYSHFFDRTVFSFFIFERRHALHDVGVGISGVDGIAVEEEKTW